MVVSLPERDPNKPSRARIGFWIVAVGIGLYLIATGVIGIISNGG